MESKKGQAAAEYLVTYGWALLLLVAVIAIILSTGIFNASYFISEECVLQPDIACTGYQLYQPAGGGDTTLLMMVEDRLGYAIRIDSVTITTNDIGAAGTKNWTARPDTQNPELDQGMNTTFKFTFSGNKQPPLDSMQRMNVLLTYYSCAREVNPTCEAKDEYKHTVAGRITARVAKKD